MIKSLHVKQIVYKPKLSISGIRSVQSLLIASWLMTMAEWKPINGKQTQLNIDE